MSIILSLLFYIASMRTDNAPLTVIFTIASTFCVLVSLGCRWDDYVEKSKYLFGKPIAFEVHIAGLLYFFGAIKTGEQYLSVTMIYVICCILCALLSVAYSQKKTDRKSEDQFKPLL